MIKMLFLAIAICFSCLPASAIGDEKSNKIARYIDPNDVDKAKHMRHEFVAIHYLDGSIKNSNRRKLSLAGNRQSERKINSTSEKAQKNQIDTFNKTIEKYREFPDINDWENAQILAVKADLALLEKRYNDSIKLRAEIVNGGHITDETLGYQLHQLSLLYFKLSKYSAAKETITNAFLLKHILFPWDYANLAEMSYRLNMYDEAKFYLTKAIDTLEKNDCPVENHWLEINKSFDTNINADHLKQLALRNDPWFYTVLPDFAPYVKKFGKPSKQTRRAMKDNAGYLKSSQVIDDKGEVVCVMMIKGVNQDSIETLVSSAKNTRYLPAKDNNIAVWTYGYISTNARYRRR